jgi:hypothetical protein
MRRYGSCRDRPCAAGRGLTRRCSRPPNHKLVPIHILGISHPDNHPVAIAVTGVTQDEPVNGLGDGDTSPDAVVQKTAVLLRAERAGARNGRVYRVQFEADDGVGGVCTGSVSVRVPKEYELQPGCQRRRPAVRVNPSSIRDQARGELRKRRRARRVILTIQTASSSNERGRINSSSRIAK